MSYKIPMKNGINCTEAQWIKNNNLVDASVKLAGEEAKDRLYEPKHKKKLVRVLTVIAYVFFVSLAAIMLSLYYVFLWNGGQKNLPEHSVQTEVPVKCKHFVAEIHRIAGVEADEISFATSSPVMDEETVPPLYDSVSDSDGRQRTLIYKFLQPEND